MKIKLTPSNTSPTSDRGIKVDYAPAKRGGYNWQRYLIAAIIIAPFLFLSWQVLGRMLRVEGVGRVELPYEEILAPEDGMLQPVTIKDGQLAPGTLLARLDPNPELPAAIASPVASSRIDPQILARQQVLDVNIHIASEREYFLRKELAVQRRLFDQGALTRAELNGQMEQVQLAHEQKLTLQAERSGVLPVLPTSMPTPVSRPVFIIRNQLAGRVREKPQVAGWVARNSILYRIENPAGQAQLAAFFQPADLSLLYNGKEINLTLAGGHHISGTLKLDPQSLRVQSATTSQQQGMQTSIRALIIPDQPLPDAARINGLPFSISLDWNWPWK